MLDSYVYGDALRISPEAPVPVLKVVKREHRCGGASSVAADIMALGGNVVCLGVVGDDQNGKVLVDILDDIGADTSGLLKVSNRPTICKQRLIGLAQHRHKQQLIRMDDEMTEEFGEKEIGELVELFKRHVKDCDVVCLQDYNKGLLCDSTCGEFIKLAKAAGKKVLVDPALTSDYKKYTGASLITPNRRETSEAVGFEIRDEATAAKGAEVLKNKLGLEAVVITLDKEGAYLLTDDICEMVGTIPRNVYDVTGAGDMVLATLAMVLACGYDYRSAVQLANIAGGLEVEKFGVATVTVDEIVNEIVRVHRRSGGKLRDIVELVTILEWHKKQRETVVFTNGCFDVLHRGHVEYFKFCKEQGDILVVGLNSDRSVREIKGAGRPVNSQDDRAGVLEGLEAIDYIVIFDEADPLETIKKVLPDVLVKGADWAEKGVVGSDVVESHGGKVVLAPLVEGKSSTSTIEKIKSLEKKS